VACYTNNGRWPEQDECVLFAHMGIMYGRMGMLLRCSATSWFLHSNLWLNIYEKIKSLVYVQVMDYVANHISGKVYVTKVIIID
jgi:hypothetical protein